ncbi:MAG TPA: hypothetical protein VLF62_05240 [Candidatus Saccharimonadales bacterium]|nr:hypothetical protein [Candidatus Saccharimonadales bacterium]
MKSVEVMEIRAMLKEILATTDATPEDVSAVLTIGTPAMGLERLSGPAELSTVLKAVEHASPASSGKMRITEDTWRRLESEYSRRVVQPLFA